MSEALSLYIALYTDADVTTDLAVALRERDYVAQSAAEAGLADANDDVQLAYAVEHRMTLLTFNTRDFGRLNKEYALQGRTHYGIVVSTEQFGKKRFGELLRQTLHLLETYSADEMINRLVYLQEFR
jgi:hypothetical protein